MDADSYAHRPVRARVRVALGFPKDRHPALNRVAGGFEDDIEAVALRLDLGTTNSTDLAAHQPAVVGDEGRGCEITVALDEGRVVAEIREQEREGAHGREPSPAV